MKKKSKFSAAALATAVLAVSLVGISAAPASAAGSCSSVLQSGQNIVGSCKGTVYISWTCSSSTLPQVYGKRLETGVLGQSFSFKACNQVAPRNINFRSAN